MEYLNAIDTLIVEQLVEMLEVQTGIETANRYIIRNGAGQQIFFAFEDSSEMAKAYGGKNRAFTMVLNDNWNRQVCRIHRPHANPWQGGSRCMVEAPLGANAGYVQQNGPGFICYDAVGQAIAHVIAPVMAVGTHPFQILSAPTMIPVGEIVKHYGGAWKETFTDADTFSLRFPIGLNLQMKIVLLAAVFLIDFQYFEDTTSDRRNCGR